MGSRQDLWNASPLTIKKHLDLTEITPLILTYNEAPNLRRTLGQLNWASQIVVIDSGSSDETPAIAAEFSALFIQRPFDTHEQQWNFGLEQVSTRWVLTLDADYFCPSALAEELAALTPDRHCYAAEFRYCNFGKPLRAALYPPRVVLFQTERFRYTSDGHTQVLDTGGEPVGELLARIDHDDRKSLRRWMTAQIHYASLEADKLLSTPVDSLNWKDRLRQRICFAPVLTLFYCLFGKRLILDHWHGLYYTGQRVIAELLLSLYLLDRKLRSRGHIPEKPRRAKSPQYCETPGER